MILQPSNTEQLVQALAQASARKEKIECVDLSALNRVIEHTAEDMTVTVECGATLTALQTELAKHRQWLAMDPPNPDQLTIGALINSNVSGPRRFGYGTIRDYLIGIKVILADGTVIHSGGKVVKNVAGYDLMKLFIGSHGSIGVSVEATFKLRPLPELEKFVQVQCKSLEVADRLIEAVIKSEITPVVLDLHQISKPENNAVTVVLGFAGTREEVEWQLAKAADLGFNQHSSLDYEATFWADSTLTHRLSVLPSTIVRVIRNLDGAPFIARAGNGIIYHRGTPAPRSEVLPLELMRRVKDAYDPNHILPELPL
ncbi:MAG: FAD-binding oxidoreductase [Pedosphaera sp.]|nr:FAD-binding oxidoreductase [Pedosphaera sp.]